MNKNLIWLKVLAIMTILTLLAVACAPGDIERIPVAGQEQSGGEVGGEAGAAGDLGANFELPPTQPVCPTPTPTVGVGTTGGGEDGVGEAVVGPATSPETVSGDTSTGAPAPDVLDQVDQS